MAIRSTFYDTTPEDGVKETEWAQSALSRGPLYGVGGPDDLKLTAHPTTPYAVNIGPGKFFGHGVWDENDSTALVQCATPAAGTTRWDLIAGRRDWQPAGGGPTSLRSISGTATLAIPAGRENRPGVVDDQPVWLIQWKAGLPQPQQIIDLRCWAGPGGVEVAHDLALQYLGAPGAVVRTPNGVSRYQRGANNVWGWVPVDDYRPTLAIEGAEATAPKIKAGTVTVRTDANGAGAVVFKERFPLALSSAYIQQAHMTTLGMVDCRWDEGLSGPHRLAFFAFNAAGERLRNLTGLRLSYIAVGD